MVPLLTELGERVLGVHVQFRREEEAADISLLAELRKTFVGARFYKDTAPDGSGRMRVGVRFYKDTAPDGAGRTLVGVRFYKDAAPDGAGRTRVGGPCAVQKRRGSSRYIAPGGAPEDVCWGCDSTKIPLLTELGERVLGCDSTRIALLTELGEHVLGQGGQTAVHENIFAMYESFR
jgi:hypothetical protein